MNKSLTVLVALLIAAVAGVVVVQSSVNDPNGSRGQTIGKTPKLTLVTGGSSTYWQAIKKGAMKAGEDLGVTVDVLMPEADEDTDAQTTLIASIDASKVDGVAISPLDADKQTRVINQLGDQTKVVTVDSDAPFSNRLNYVGASNIEAGRESARLVKEAIPDGGKVVVLIANETKQNVLERKEGFVETLTESTDDDAKSKYEIVGFLVDNGDLETCQEQLEGMVKDQSEIACVVGMNSYHGAVLAELAKEKLLPVDIKLIAFDAEPATLDGIESGVLYASIAQNPYLYGYEAIGVLDSFCRRPAQQLPPPGVYATTTIGTRVVKKDNLEEFRPKESDQKADEAQDTAEAE